MGLIVWILVQLLVMVEDEFAVRVVLQVGGRGRDQFGAAIEQRVSWHPAQARAQGLVPLEAGEESVRDEGIAAIVKAIPFGGGHFIERARKPELSCDRGTSPHPARPGNRNRRK